MLIDALPEGATWGLTEFIRLCDKMAALFDAPTVKKMLAELKQEDPCFNVLGSGAHRYELNPPLPIHEVEAFESKYELKLPQDYRRFIGEIGNGGAGPYYGVFRFGEHDDSRDFLSRDGDHLVGDLSADFPHNEAWNLPKAFWETMPNPGPETTIEEEDRLMESWDKELDEHYWNPQIMNGAIPICHLGCALRHWLVLKGPQRGFVWADKRVDNHGVAPIKRNGIQQTFADWYMSWLANPLIV